jgi:hypothetical protein
MAGAQGPGGFRSLCPKLRPDQRRSPSDVVSEGLLVTFGCRAAAGDSLARINSGVTFERIEYRRVAHLIFGTFANRVKNSCGS